MPEENIVAGPPLERLLESSLGELLLALLRNYGENVIQVDASTNEELKANLLLARSITLAKWLKNEGVIVGDSISIMSENRIEFCVIPVATLFVGATFAPLNPEYTPGELKHVLNLSKPKICFCTEKTIAKINNIQRDHPYIKKIVFIGKESIPYENVVKYEDIIAGITADDADEDFEEVPIDPKEAVATILCSSGTTGLPKGVMCTHDNMTSYIDIARYCAQELAYNDDPSDALMGLTPFFHSFGFMLMFLNILRGKKMVIIRKFNPKTFLESIQKHKVARLIVPPPILLFLLKHPLVKQYDLSCVKEVRSGAAPMGKDTETELKHIFKTGHVSQGYGMTETTLSAMLTYDGPGKVGSVGKIVPGMFAKVIDENGRALPAHQEGELCLKGPLIMKGYVGDKVATESTIDKDGWLHTGDVAYYDKDGYFFIVDRLKELIKYKGYQVAPAELEALLLTHDAVQDAAVIGLPDEDAGELPLAYIVRKPGKTVIEAEIEKFVADNVSKQKQLRGGVVFVNDIPRNATGKILRRILRDQAKMMRSKL